MALLGAEVIGEQPAAVRLEVRALLGQLARRDRRHERVRVDLTVRVMQRDAHLDAAILEREDVLHVVTRAELLVTLRPHVDEELEV